MITISQLEKILIEYIEQQRKLYHSQPFLSDHENGVIVGVNDTLDDIERILEKVK